MKNSCLFATISATTIFILASSASALPPAPMYRLDVAGFNQGADFGLVTGMNNSAQTVFIRNSFGTRSYWWNGSQEIELLPGDSLSQSSVLDLDDNGVAVGLRLYLGSTRLAMIWEQGVPRNLGTMGGSESTAGAINDHGIVAGWSSVAGGSKHLFTWQEGFTDLGALPPISSCCHTIEAINNSNQIVGHADGSLLNGWEYTNGQFVVLHDLNGGNDSTPRNINDTGLVVGTSWPGQGTMRPVTWTNGQVHALTMTEGAVSGEAYATDAASDIAGNLVFPDTNGFRSEATLWTGGTPLLLRDIVTNLGDWQLRKSEAMNDRGQILVYAYSDTNSYRRVILTPIPEPLTAYLALIATWAFLAFFFRTRNRVRHSLTYYPGRFPDPAAVPVAPAAALFHRLAADSGYIRSHLDIRH